MAVSPVPIRTLGENLRTYGGIRQFEILDERPKYYMSLLISKYSRQTLMSAATGEPLANVVMPLPTPLNDALNVSYDEEAVGAVLGNVVNWGSSMINGNNRPDSESVGPFSTAASMVGSMVGRIPYVGPALNSLGANPTAAAKAWFGLSPNQFFVILLKGPKYKTYEFQWRFSPKTPKESENLRKTLQYLRNAISPGLGAHGAIFRFPRIFNICFVPNSKYLYKFKPAVCESLTVNYTPAGQPAFYRTSALTADGGRQLNAPEGVDVAMRFLEIEYWIHGDHNDNNFPLDTRVGVASTPFGPPVPQGFDSENPFNDGAQSP